jgi:hypothetical protein
LLRKGAASLRYEPLVGFINSKSAAITIFEHNGNQFIRVERDEYLSPGVHSFILQFKVRGLLQKGNTSTSISWPIAQPWKGGVRAFVAAIILPEGRVPRDLLASFIEVREKQRKSFDVKPITEGNMVKFSGGPTEENTWTQLLVDFGS